MKNLFLVVCSLLLILNLTSTAWALDLEEARTTKKITELSDGYIKANDPSAKDLEKEVNAKRRKAYEDIAKEHGGKLSVEQIGQQAAEKIKEKTK